MIFKHQTTNHGTPIPPMHVSIGLGYRVLESHMEGNVQVIEKVELMHASIFDGTLGPNGPAVLVHRNDETDHEFSRRLVAALYPSQS